MPEEHEERLLSRHLNRLPRWAKLMAIPAVAVLVALAMVWGATEPPDTSAPSSTEAGNQIARALGVPDSADDELMGDLLIERFYIFDIVTGQTKVGDVCKGRIKDVVVSKAGDWSGYDYRLSLDRGGLERERDRISTFVNTTVPPELPQGAQYAGLVVQGGNLSSVFPLNYTGKLPVKRARFQGPEGEDIWMFMRKQDYTETSKRLRLVGFEGNNFLLRTTADSAYYQTQFKVEKAIMLAELIIVDTNTPAPQSTFR